MKVKRIIFIASSVFLILLVSALAFLYLWIGISIKANIKTAQELYPGNAEDALISLMLDENYSAMGRTHTAIWTLGQLKSKKALPTLYELYKDDPKGKTCYGKHDSLLCQYEIYKAIRSIEGRSLFSYKKLNH